MAEKIILAKLEFDVQGMIKDTARATEALEKLKKEKIELEAATKKDTEAIVKNNAAQKRQKTTITQNTKAIAELTTAENKLRKSMEAATQALQKEVKTIDQARANNKELTRARNNVNVSTKEGQRVLGLLNQKLDKNNQFIKRNVDGLTKQKIGVGKYSQALSGVASRFTGVALVATAAFKAINAIGQAFTDALRRVRQFDKEMVNLGAILGKSKYDLGLLRSEIVSVAGSSIRTSTEVAQLASVLVKLGKTESEVRRLLEPVNNLSIALNATSEDAGKLLVNTLNAFGEGASEAQRFADVLAKSAVTSALDFTKLSESLAYVAPTAKAVGLSIENTTAILGTLVDNGIKASRAGRLLSTAFIRLAGKGYDLDSALDAITSSTDKLAVADELFGKEAAGISLILADNTAKVDELTESLKNAQGVLKELTDLQLESLDAKLGILDSSWERFILSIEDGTGVLGKATGGTIAFFTKITDWGTTLNNASDNIVQLYANIRNSVTENGRNYVREQAEERRLLKEKLSLVNELTKAYGLEAGVVDSVGRAQLIRAKEVELLSLSNEQLQERLDLLDDEEAKRKITEQAEDARLAKEKAAADEARRQEEKRKEERTLATQIFLEKKRQLEEDAYIREAADEEERELRRVEKFYDNKELEFERLGFQAEELRILKEALLIEEQDALQAIRDKYAEKEVENSEVKATKLKKVDNDIYNAEKALAKKRAGVQQSLSNALGRLLGDSIAARIAAIAVDAAIDVANVKGEGSKNQAVITSSLAAANMKAIALTGNPLFAAPIIAKNIAAAGVATASNAAATTAGINGILASGAIGAVGNSIKFEDGGLQEIGGERHSSGGTKFWGEDGTHFEAEKGELIGVMSRHASKAFMDFNNSYTPKKSTSAGKFESGGTITPSGSNPADIVEIIKQIPPPVVIVQDIVDGIQNQVDVVDGATF